MVYSRFADSNFARWVFFSRTRRTVISTTELGLFCVLWSVRSFCNNSAWSAIKLTIRESCFRKIYRPGKTSSGKCLSGKNIRESYYPGNDCLPFVSLLSPVCEKDAKIHSLRLCHVMWQIKRHNELKAHIVFRCGDTTPLQYSLETCKTLRHSNRPNLTNFSESAHWTQTAVSTLGAWSQLRSGRHPITRKDNGKAGTE